MVSILGGSASPAGQRGRVVRVLLRSVHGRLLSLSALSLPLSLPPALSLPLPRSAATGEPKRATPANAATAAAIGRSALHGGLCDQFGADMGDLHASAHPGSCSGPQEQRLGSPPQSWLVASGVSRGYAVARRAAISFESNVDGVPDKPPSDLVGPRVRRSDDPGLCRSGEAAVRSKCEILYRHASSRQRDDTGKTTLGIGQADEPITASGAGDLPSLDGPSSVGERDTRRGRRLRPC
jgi:hypothetical protein